MKILFLISAVLFFPEISMADKGAVSESVSEKAVESQKSLPAQSHGNSYIFAIHQQAEAGINSLRLLPEIIISGLEDDLSHGVWVQADIQRRAAIFLRHCRTINQYSELTKLIYPFHFFF